MAASPKKYELRVLVSCDDPKTACYLKRAYSSPIVKGSIHSSGVDLVVPRKIVVPRNAIGFKIPMGIKMMAVKNKKKIVTVHTSTGTSVVKENVFNPMACEVHMRSSTSIHTPLRLANHVGIIDLDYRGELHLLIDNISDRVYTIEQGARLMQVCLPNKKPFDIVIVDSLPESARGESGLGSSGSSV